MNITLMGIWLGVILAGIGRLIYRTARTTYAQRQLSKPIEAPQWENYEPAAEPEPGTIYRW